MQIKFTVDLNYFWERSKLSQSQPNLLKVVENKKVDSLEKKLEVTKPMSRTPTNGAEER